MKPRPPTSQEVEELLSFLPRLYRDVFTPVRSWHGGTKREGRVRTMPWPEYDPVVEAFVRAASRECWRDYGYRPEDARRVLGNEDAVKAADLAQIRAMLTYCVRGERFYDGHWGDVIESGQVRRLLERLAELRPDHA